MRTPNINKLYNKLLECESEWNALEKSGFKIAVAISNGRDMGAFQSCRNRFRTIYERFLVEEPEFFVKNLLFDGFWRNCYAKHIDDLQVAIKEHKNLRVVNNLTQFLRRLIFEGVSLFSLLLRANFSSQVRFELLLLLAQLKHLQNGGQEQALLQEAIRLFPEDGRPLFLLGKFAQTEGDLLLALFWCLSALAAKRPAGEEAMALLKTLANHICERPAAVLYSPSRLKYMKPAKRAALDSTLLAIGPVLQLLVHGISNQLCSKSHFKHMDQFAHARLNQLKEEEIDFDVIKRVMEAFWMALLNTKLFLAENLILPQAVMMAGLFRFMHKYRLGGVIQGIRLYSGKNYEIASKIYPFFTECLHEFLESLPVDQDDPYIAALLHYGLLAEQDGAFLIRPVVERSNRVNRSMKVLTHRLLEVRVNELASPIEAAERLQQRPWKIIDFEALLEDWEEIRADCQGNRERYLITLALIDQLDVAKNTDSQVQKIIRFILTEVSASNPSLRLQSVHEESSSLRIDREEFKFIEQMAAYASESGPFTWKALIRFWCEHLKAIRFFFEKEPEMIENCCFNPIFTKNKFPE